MKKIIAMLLALSLVLAFAGCASEKPAETTTAPETTAAPEVTEEVPDTSETGPAEAEGTVMTHAEYVAADLESAVCVETYVQATQSWWNNQITVYAQSEDGAYFIYNMECSEENAAKLVPGAKIRVTGYKAEWSGEVEIVDGTFELLEGSYTAEPTDVTELLGTDDLIKHQNELVSLKGLTIESYTKDGEDYHLPFVYKDNNSGDHDSNSDLYFNASINGQTYSFCVESYLCDNTTDVYAAVENLKIGDVVDLEGFLYWYNGSQPHITSVVVK